MGGGGGKEEGMSAEMWKKDAFRPPQVLSDRRGTNIHTVTFCSAGFSVCGSHSVVITLRHTDYLHNPAHALCRDPAQKNMMSCLHSYLCVCVRVCARASF